LAAAASKPTAPQRRADTKTEGDVLIMVGRSRTCSAHPLRALFAGVGVLLAACHGSTTTAPGTPVLTMDDLSPDPQFASYIVTLDGITLTDTNGNVVYLMSSVETIDLAKYNGITELVEAPAVASATYVSASITLDYSAASIYVNEHGEAIASTPVDTTGAAPTTLVIPVTFDPDHRLVITQGQSTRVHFSIDLTASNHIDYSTSPPTVTVQPFATLSPAPVDDTVMLSRGLLVVSQPSSGNFIMNTRPFYDLVSALGALTVNTNAHTYFSINGLIYTGTAGLTAMTTQMENSPTAVYGTLGNLSGITPTFNATSVYVGTSLESLLAEYITGVVFARSGDTLSVRGASFLSPLNVVTQYNLSYLPTVPVTVGSGTLVTEDGVAAGGLSSSSISVGQQITVAGQVVTNSAGAITQLDATVGNVRLQPTTAWGTLNSASPGTASLDLLSLGSFAPSGFAFAGTGRTTYQSPTTYELSTGALNESAVPAGTLLEATGIVTPFGSAPPDFAAMTVAPGTSTLQQLVVEWTNGGSAKPFTSIHSTGLTVDLQNADLSTTRYIRTGPTTVDLTTLPATPLITTTGANPNNLVLALGSASLTSGVSIFNDAARFATALNTALNGSNKAFRLVAYGQYNATTNTFVASRILVAFEQT
jgi:hypothetical protein